MGRVREFDAEVALKDIKQTFWRLGYEGTSMRNLEDATGISKQSLYRAFKSKKNMYLLALDNYEKVEISDVLQHLTGPEPVRFKFKRMFDYIVDNVISSGDRRGCFFCNAIADQTQLDSDIGGFVKNCFNRTLERFEEALKGDASYNKDEDLRLEKAFQILMSYLGLRLMIKANVDEQVLWQSVETAVQTL